MTLLAFDGSYLDAGMNSHLHRTPDSQTNGSKLNAGVDFHLHRTPESQQGMFVVVDGMDLGYRFRPSLNDLEGGGGETWMMEMMEHGIEMTLDQALVSLKPSDETTKTSRVLGLSIVETKRLTTSHERAHQK
ncbi:hypothetical protein HID58_021681 [Brassica napus]|uniref:BnaA06g11120D protein n=2 Tax=Brassica napus TaxID=3708 RepID=A0A078HBG8_BRANA|nr:hypothetical protein HID58_021681 [Brassica napus]CAF2083525.1 unnamed protein product [Brassica napus]CDY35102.1 BnaA06g11120D [Brassica napus]